MTAQNKMYVGRNIELDFTSYISTNFNLKYLPIPMHNSASEYRASCV